MAPGLNGRQTGTVPKSKSRSSESQSHRLTCEPFGQLPILEWEHMSDIGNKNHSKKKSCTSRSETEADSLRHDLGTSRSSTMTSQNGNGESCSYDSFSGKINVPDRKQVTNKLSQIQSYVQQTAALMNTLKASDTPCSEGQYKKLSGMLEDLKDSESKLTGLLNKMDCTESRIESLLTDVSELQCGSNEADEEELSRRSKESKKKLEVLQKRKQDLLKLQEKAKKQLQEAQAEQSRLVTRASTLSQELSANKLMDSNVQQLSHRLKAVQEMYATRNQITDSLIEKQKAHKIKTKYSEEDQTEMSDTETDFQLVVDKMEELDAMKVQLGQIQKIMASINAIQNSDLPSTMTQSNDDFKELDIDTEGDCNGEDGNNNLIKLEQAKSKLNHLTQLLEVVQSAQNSNTISPSYLQMISNLVNDETNSFTESPSTASSVKSPQRNSEEISVQTMQTMTKELEETTAAMKEERDRLLAARQELQDIAKRLPVNKSEAESVSPDYDSGSEPPCLKPATLDSNTRESFNGFTEAEQSSNCNDSSLYVVGPSQNRNKQRGMWHSPSPGSNCTNQERRSKNESLSRSSNHSVRVSGRDQPHWSPSPSVNYYNERPNFLSGSQQQLEMSGNLCEMMLSESFQKGIRPNDISLHEMFAQHQLLTRTVAQCSQLLWLQQKQIIELRNAFMLQCGSYPNQFQSIASNQSHLNVPTMSNSSFLTGASLSNSRFIPPVPVQQHQNFAHPLNQKLNAGDIQNAQTPHQDFPEQYCQFPDGFGCEMRSGNFNRFNSNTNHNFHQNLSSGFSNRGPNGMNSMVPEDSGALNNQVPPGNRANNYWDNFRSYSRQNLLSNTKSNEDTGLSRRCFGASTLERPPRDFIPFSLHNNQSVAGTSQQTALSHAYCESASNDPILLPPSQNTRPGHHLQVTRSCSSDSQNQRNPGKNESRHQENDSRNKNESCGSGRSKTSDSSLDFKSVRNDVSQGFRNMDNINSSRNFIQLVRDIDNEEVAQGNNKKRLDRSRCRNEGAENLNNRSNHNTSLWDSISAEVSNFIRANESRPHFLLQLFRDLQLVITDSLRQRILVTIEETVTANNLTDRTSNMSGGNVNIIENRNNIRQNRSNLNRNLTEDPDRIDELFYHLRENQNTIRQNIGMSSYMLGGNLENPNISNIRDLRNSRNNLENEGLRDLRTYFEANLCNFGHNSTLENPNLSNIRENLTRRAPGMTDIESVHPKNVYLSIHDNAVEPRRRNQESPDGPDFGSYRNFQLSEDFGISRNCENLRDTNSHFEVENNFEGAVEGRTDFQENRLPSSRYPVLLGGDNFARSRQFLGSGNDSGIDINFNNDERKRSLAEGDSNVNDGAVKVKKNGGTEVEGATAFVLRGEWERNGGRDSFDSPSREDATSPFVSICDNSFLRCRTFQQSDDGDLAEADQSRNEETSAAESNNGYINSQIVDAGVNPTRNQQSGDNAFSSQNIPEAERNLLEGKNCEINCDVDGACAMEPEGNLNLSSKTEGNGEGKKNESSDNFYYPLKVSSCSESTPVPKSGVKHRKRVEETEGETAADLKKSASKNSTNKFRDNSVSQGKFSGFEDLENRKIDTDSVVSGGEGRQPCDSSDSLYYGAFQLALDESVEAEKGNTSPEAECGSGLDQVPTRLNKAESPRKSEGSGGS